MALWEGRRDGSLMCAPRRRGGVAARSRQVMTEEEAQRFVLGFLADGRKHTTEEVDGASAASGKRCPDATVRFLAKLRLRGLILGELSLAHRSWLWWRPEFPDAAAPEPAGSA
jgi:hypothetical protein